METHTALTLLVGIIVAYVGWLQHKLARDRLKLDLFEKRFAVYKGAQVFLTHILRDAAVDLEKAFAFKRDTQDATFLFKPEIQTYLDSLYKRALDLRSVALKYEPLPVGQERSALCQQESDLLKSLTDELPQLHDKFGRYLKFKDWI